MLIIILITILTFPPKILKVKGFKRPMKSERKFDVLDNLQFLFKNLQK